MFLRIRIAIWLLVILTAGAACSASASVQASPLPPAASESVQLDPPAGSAGPPSPTTPAVSPTAGSGQEAAAVGDRDRLRLDLSSMLFVFMLATFIGLQVIGRVSRLLYTPLMSLTNAISAIAVVGAIIVTGGDHPPYITILGAIALFASMTNIVSGFLITDRMLKMFKTRKADKP
jgi:H+-translocating NAD(P) transhydrogenase subunit alpha